MRFLSCAFLCCIFWATAAIAQAPSPATSSPPFSGGDVLATGTALGVTNGFSSRFAAGLNANFNAPGFEVHVQGNGLWQEESAAFFAGGFSVPITPNLKSTVLAGTSTANQGILPQLYLYGKLAYATPPDVGVIIAPAFTYRSYRNGVQESVPRLELIYYLPPSPSGSFVLLQAFGSVAFVSPGYHTGFEVSGAVSYNVPRKWSLGIEGFGGVMAYDNILCVTACGIQNGFIGARPKLTLFATDTIEVILRGEIVRTDFYNMYGGTLGVKVSF